MTNEQYARDMLQLRREAAAEINRLINFLDDLGGDPDLEPNGDNEPSLGWTTRGNVGGCDDLELDTADDEPSLGWTIDGRLGRPTDDEQGSDDEPDHENGFDGHIRNPGFYAKLKSRRLETKSRSEGRFP